MPVVGRSVSFVVTIAAFGAWFDVVISRVPGLLELFCGLGVIAILALASARMDLQGFSRALTHVKTSSSKVALTFDDGPDPDTTPLILAILSQHNVKSTFFVLSDKAQKYPGLITRILNEGHELGNHGRDHNWRSLLTPAKARASLNHAAKVLTQVAGVAPIFFRPPYGVTTPALALAIRELGVTLVGWTLRSFDTINWGDAQKRACKLARRMQPGAILLLHDAPEKPGGRLPLGSVMLAPILSILHKRGLKAVTVSELISSSTV